jgi:hypothetical protein
MDEMRIRTGPLSRIIEQAVSGDRYLWRYGGCYLAATGDRGQQAFVPQLLERLFKDRNSVNWSEQIEAADQKCHSQTRLGYYLITLAWIAAIVFLVWRFKHLFQ